MRNPEFAHNFQESEIDHFPVHGDIQFVRKKLLAGFAVAFLMNNKFEIYISKDNMHESIIKEAGVPSNNSSNILVKGRISPKTKSFIISNSDRVEEAQIKARLGEETLLRLSSEVVRSLQHSLGTEFESYSIQH